MISVNSKNNRLIRLTDERIKHITENHPEMKNCTSWILETIESPDVILAGDYGFILTAYFSRNINKTRRIVWKP